MYGHVRGCRITDFRSRVYKSPVISGNFRDKILKQATIATFYEETSEFDENYFFTIVCSLRYIIILSTRWIKLCTSVFFFKYSINAYHYNIPSPRNIMVTTNAIFISGNITAAFGYILLNL
jgi:hypothetical protein